MKILYGVCGDGMGHAMRSAVVARHLESRGHELRFASYGRAYDYLFARWPGRVTKIAGLSSSISAGSVSPEMTLLTNSLRQAMCLPLHALAFADVMMDPPDVVVSDFDPWTARFAWLTQKPLVAVDNIHFMNRFNHPADVVASDIAAASLMFPVVEHMVPGASTYLVTSFVYAPAAKPDTTLQLPILRPEILAAKSLASGSHVVAYFNDKASHGAIADVFAQVGAPVRLYGEKGRTSETVRGAVTLCPFSDARFIADMASSRAVIGGAGFTFMTEAIYLGKPMLALPFGGHFEQILNANYLQRLGWGERCCELEPGAVAGFLSRVPEYTSNLRGFQHDGNVQLLRSVEHAIGALP